MMNKNTPIIKEVLIAAPAEKVWRAVTTPEGLKEWCFDIAELKLEIGYEFQFEGGKDGRVYVHNCKILEVVPHKKFAYSWVYEGYEGYSVVTFELTEEQNKTRLKLTHEGIESFESLNPDFAKTNFIDGWTQLIQTALKEYVEQL